MGVPYRRRRTASQNHVLFCALDTHNAVNCSKPRVRTPGVKRYAGLELDNSSQTRSYSHCSKRPPYGSLQKPLTRLPKKWSGKNPDDADHLPLDT